MIEIDEETKRLMIDACVALESMLYPEFADTSIDPNAVNQRLLAWLDAHLNWEAPRFNEAATVLGAQ